MTETLFRASAVLCFAVAIVLTTMAVWFRFRWIARAIVNSASTGAILTASWNMDVVIRSRFSELSNHQVELGEIAGFCWIGAGIMAAALALLYHTENGNADDHGEPSTQRAFAARKKSQVMTARGR